MALLSGGLFQRLWQRPPRIEQDLGVRPENPHADELIVEQLRNSGMFITLLTTDRDLHGGRREVPDPCNSALKGALLDAIRLNPMSKPPRQAANQQRTDTKTSCQHST